MPMTSTPRTSPSTQDNDTAQSTAMFTVHGVGVVDGVAIGRAVVMGTTALEVPHYYITTAEIESEIARLKRAVATVRSEEHTSELQSRGHLVCRLLLEK